MNCIPQAYISVHSTPQRMGVDSGLSVQYGIIGAWVSRNIDGMRRCI
jgi:hypothetical protein